MSTPIQAFTVSVDLLRHILWQYNDAEHLQTLLADKQNWLDQNQTRFWQDWQQDVFNLATANDFGLAVWGFLLGEDRNVDMGAAHTNPAFGFAGRRNFTSNFSKTAGLTRLSKEQYRLLLRLRYYKLVSRGTVPEINKFLVELFGDQGRVFVLDTLDMAYAIYVFSFMPASWQRFVLEDMDALPRPAGVGLEIRILTRTPFGFGPHRKNFTTAFAESLKGSNG